MDTERNLIGALGVLSQRTEGEAGDFAAFTADLYGLFDAVHMSIPAMLIATCWRGKP